MGTHTSTTCNMAAIAAALFVLCFMAINGAIAANTKTTAAKPTHSTDTFDLFVQLPAAQETSTTTQKNEKATTSTHVAAEEYAVCKASVGACANSRLACPATCVQKYYGSGGGYGYGNGGYGYGGGGYGYGRGGYGYGRGGYGYGRGGGYGYGRGGGYGGGYGGGGYGSGGGGGGGGYGGGGGGGGGGYGGGGGGGGGGGWASACKYDCTSSCKATC